MSNSETLPTFLGSGGSAPCLSMLVSGYGGVMPLAVFPEGHSVYGMDIDPTGRWIAAATRGRQIHVLSLANEDGTVSRVERRVFHHGAPVLRVIFMDEQTLMTCDTLGRCLTWDMERPDFIERTRFPALKGAIGVLFRANGDRIVYLSSTGELIIVRRANCQTIEERRVPVPARPLALLRPTLWHDGATLLYPGHSGQLVSHHLETGHTDIVQAHDGEFTALTVTEDSVLTVGVRDGLLKRWHPGHEDTVAEIRAPRGTTAISSLDSSGTTSLLLTEEGTAEIHRIDCDELQLIQRLPGNHYRTVLGPNSDAVRRFHAHRTTEEAKRLARVVQTQIGRGDGHDAEADLEQLKRLGFENVALALSADQARLNGETLRELRLRQSLTALLPTQQCAAASLRRYGELLEELWQEEAAYEVYRRVLDIAQDHALRVRVDNLAERVRVMNSGTGIIKADQPLPTIAQAADVIGRPLTGFWVWKTKKAIRLPDLSCTPDAIVCKCRRVCEEQGHEGLRTATENVEIVTRERTDRSVVIFFGGNREEGEPGLRYAIEVGHAMTNSVVTPMVLFDAGRPACTEDSKKHNRKVLDSMQEARSMPLIEMEIGKVHGTVMTAIRRLLTLANALKDDGCSYAISAQGFHT